MIVFCEEPDAMRVAVEDTGGSPFAFSGSINLCEMGEETSGAAVSALTWRGGCIVLIGLIFMGAIALVLVSVEVGVGELEATLVAIRDMVCFESRPAKALRELSEALWGSLSGRGGTFGTEPL